MPRKKNLLLAEVFGLSLAAHVVALVVLGSVTIWHAIYDEDTDFEAAPQQIEEVQEKRREVTLSAPDPRNVPVSPRIEVANFSGLNPPPMDLDIPAVDMQVAVGGVGGGAGAEGIEGEEVDFDRMKVNFFGLESAGEKVVFIVDADRSMLLDVKGGLNAYSIIKEEIVRMVEGLPPGTLFNVYFYAGGRASVLEDRWVRAGNEGTRRVREWIEPINKDMRNIGRFENNVNLPRDDIEPLGRAANTHWFKPLVHAMSNGADTIFMMVPQWYTTQEQLSPQQMERARDQYRRDLQNWQREWADKWREARRTASEWLAKENERREKRGLPKKVIRSYNELLRELQQAGVIDKELQFPPSLERESYSPEEITKFTQNAAQVFYPEDHPAPEINVVLFLGKDEDRRKASGVEQYERLAAASNEGNFRVLLGEADLMKSIPRGAGS